MRMFMNPGTCRDSVVRERHILGMKESAFPPFSRLLDVKMVRVTECHGGHLTRPSSGASPNPGRLPHDRNGSVWLGRWMCTGLVVFGVTRRGQRMLGRLAEHRGP